MRARIRKYKQAICVSLAVGSLVTLVTVGRLFAAPPPPPPQYSITFLGSLGSWSSASSVNSNGDVVGLAGPPLGPNGGELGHPDPFVYTGTQGMLNLNRLIPNPGVDYPVNVILGIDSNLYVSSSNTHEVWRYNGTTGQALGAFVSSGSGGLENPGGLVFGPDGHLYVGSRGNNQILTYNGATGASMGVFVTAGTGGALLFGPDKNGDGVEDLYATSGGTDEVLVFTGPGADPLGPAPPGAPLGALFPVDATVLDGPFGLTIGPDGALYISGAGGGGTVEPNSNVVRWDFASATLTEFIPKSSGGLTGPRHLAFGPDGKLYVANGHINNVLRYNSDGSFDTAFMPSGSGGLDVALGLPFHSGNLIVTSRDSDQILVYQGPAGANPGAFIGPFVPGTDWRLTTALDINDAGQIVGEATRLGGPTRGYRVTPAPAGTPWTLEIVEPPAGAETTHAVGINATGDVTGHVHYASSDRAFIWSPSIGTMELPAFQSFTSIKGKAINNNLQVAASAGNTGPRALRWSSTTSTWQNLGVLSGGAASAASDINGSGQVSGFSSSRKSPARAVRYTDGVGLKDLGTLGGKQSDATGINSVGEVIGWSELSGGGTRLFLYRNSGGMINLENTIVNLPSGLSGKLSAGKINDSSQICGTADDGTLEAFVLTPAP